MLALVTKFTTAHASGLAAQQSALFVEFDECEHTPESFPCVSEEDNWNFPTGWIQADATDAIGGLQPLNMPHLMTRC